MTKFCSNFFYITSYNLKNARKGKSISKMSKWPSLKHMALKSKFRQQFAFLENLEDMCVMLLESKVLLSNKFFHTNLLNFLKT